jgi:hypothetical protein
MLPFLLACCSYIAKLTLHSLRRLGSAQRSVGYLLGQLPFELREVRARAKNVRGCEPHVLTSKKIT